MIKSKKNTQKFYIELKATGKQVDRCFKLLNEYYSVTKSIKVLKAILEGVNTANNITKEPNVKLENVVNQYIEIDHDFRSFNFASISNSTVNLMSAKHLGNEVLVEEISNQITQAKELIAYSDSGENVNDYLVVIK